MQKKLTAAAGIMLAVYLTVVFYMTMFLLNDYKAPYVYLFLLAAAIAATLMLFYLFGERVSQLSFDSAGRMDARVLLLTVVLVSLAVNILYFAVSRSLSSQDTKNQLVQAVGEMPYSDWHPVLHTLLFYTLPIKLGGDYETAVLLQRIYYSLAFSYLVYVMYKNGCPMWLVLASFVFAIINPFITGVLSWALKDIGFMIFACIMLAQYIEILCSDGRWLENRINIALFALITVVCTYMRHNAVLFTAPLAVLALTVGKGRRRQKAIIAALIVIFFAAVKLLYGAIGVAKPGSRTVETIGFPATVWCSVMQNAPEALPEDTRNALYEFASAESYAYTYYTGSFNSIKFTGEIDLEKMDKLPLGSVVKYTWQCFRYAPGRSFEAAAKLTRMVWALDGADDPTLQSSFYNRWELKGADGIKAFFNQINGFMLSGSGKLVFGSVGAKFLILFAAAMLMLGCGRTGFVNILPILCYNFGTMLLLSGDDYRFFVYTNVLFLPMLFVMFKDKRKFLKTA